MPSPGKNTCVLIYRKLNISAPYYPQNYSDNGNDQQDMNKASSVKTNKSDGPSDDEDDRNEVK